MRKGLIRPLLLSAAVLVVVSATALAQTAVVPVNITEIAIATELAEGVPAAPVTEVQRGSGFVYCFMRLENPTRRPTTIYAAFEEATAGEPVAVRRGFPLSIPARVRYRTVTRTGNDLAAGSYRCVVRNEDGVVLRHTPFQVTE